MTYVPARNTILLSFALAWAEVLGAQHIFFGANAVDYSGYPDCRPEFITAFEHLANLATRAGTEAMVQHRVHAPLMTMSKAEIIRLGTSLGVDQPDRRSVRVHRLREPFTCGPEERVDDEARPLDPLEEDPDLVGRRGVDDPDPLFVCEPVPVRRGVRRRGQGSRAYRARGFGDFWQHMLVAEGAVDLAVDAVGLQPYDLAAVMVVVEEAGGTFTDRTGRRTAGDRAHAGPADRRPADRPDRGEKHHQK